MQLWTGTDLSMEEQMSMLNSTSYYGLEFGN